MKIYDNKRINYETILAAKRKDMSAIREILAHYDTYITYHSRRTWYDDYGMPYTHVDEDIKGRIQSKLIQKIIHNFDPTKLSGPAENFV
ncbi:helix-turn-helix domain-containing protein [Clostridiaceae bacterium]|nr:helix-turn-helix domain-containing protein [Clostridiaceae bacterium]